MDRIVPRPSTREAYDNFCQLRLSLRSALRVLDAILAEPDGGVDTTLHPAAGDTVIGSSGGFRIAIRRLDARWCLVDVASARSTC